MHGAKACLVAPAQADLLEFQVLRQESAAFLAPWEPLVPQAEDPDHTRRFRRMLEAGRTGTSQKHFVCRNEDMAIVGCMNLNNIVRGVFQSAMLGYWIGAPHARQGFMGDALQAALRLAFDVENLHRIEANIRPENEASRALVKRAGFRLEGYSPRYLKIAGSWCDHERYALLRDEWTPPEA